MADDATDMHSQGMMHLEKVSGSEALCSLEDLTIGQEIEDEQR